MRLSELCHLEGCGKSHGFNASHMVGSTRHNFCCLNHQQVFIAMTTRRSTNGKETAPYVESHTSPGSAGA